MMHSIILIEYSYITNNIITVAGYIYTAGPQGSACEKVWPRKARLGSYITITPIVMFGHDHTS